VSTARYRILSPAGAEREAGGADVTAADGALVLAPPSGSVLRVPFSQITSVTEPEPYTVRVTLADGNAIELSRLGVMRTQLLAELRDGRADDAAAANAAVGDAEIFTAVSQGEPTEVRVYEDAILLIGSSGSRRISFSFAGPAQVAGYAVRMQVQGGEPVTLDRLGRRTGELARLLADRLREARGRTAAFLGSLLPRLDPMELREAADLLRDGVAVPSGRLDQVHPELSGTLLRITTLPDRRHTVADLASRTDLAIGFKQLASVRKAAAGVTPWHDHAVAPHIGEHDSTGGAFQSGLMGVLAAGVLSGGPPGPGGFAGPAGLGGPGGLFGFGEGFGGYGDYWAFRALGAGLRGSEQRPMTPRPDMTRGSLTPAADDLSALTAGGEQPTVLAFALGSHRGKVVYEALNLPEPMTFVYQAAGQDGLIMINQALDAVGFQVAAVHAEGLTAAARPAYRTGTLASSLAGQVPHDVSWPARMSALLDG
jgi:hypothetical protein